MLCHHTYHINKHKYLWCLQQLAVGFATTQSYNQVYKVPDVQPHKIMVVPKLQPRKSYHQVYVVPGVQPQNHGGPGFATTQNHIIK